MVTFQVVVARAAAGAAPVPLKYSAPLPSSREFADRRSVKFLRHTRDEIGPRLPARLPAYPRAWVPGAIAPIAEPVPDARVAVWHHDPGRPTERAGEVCGGVADGDDGGAGGHQRREAVNVVHVVDVGQPLDLEPMLAFERGALGVGVAVLQVDEAVAGQAKQRRKVGEPRAFQGATDRRLADPGQADHLAAVIEPRVQRCGTCGVGHEMAALAARKRVPTRTEVSPQTAERLLL